MLAVTCMIHHSLRMCCAIRCAWLQFCSVHTRSVHEVCVNTAILWATLAHHLLIPSCQCQAYFALLPNTVIPIFTFSPSHLSSAIFLGLPEVIFISCKFTPDATADLRLTDTVVDSRSLALWSARVTWDNNALLNYVRLYGLDCSVGVVTTCPGFPIQ